MKKDFSTTGPAIWYGLLVIGIALTVWLGSGSIAPYASSHRTPRLNECGYLLNLDHPHFLATFSMLNGEPRSTWEWSVVLRRILYPLLAFPWMKLLGFEAGGFFASMIINSLAGLFLVRHVLRVTGHTAAFVTGALLVMYPGITYWGGLPYGYSVIPALVIGCFISLSKIASGPCLTRVLVWSGIIGICCTGYDLLPVYAPATVLVLIYLRRFSLILPAVGAMVLPTVAVALYLSYFKGVALTNSNSGIYLSIISAFLSPSAALYHEWFNLILAAPYIFAHNFLFSNFFALPVAFILVYGVGRFLFGAPLSVVEWSVAMATILVWSINNFAPPYSGWQMRGVWIARIYQPIFIVFMMYIGRAFAMTGSHLVARTGMGMAIMACIVAHWLVVVGPLFGLVKPADKVYYEFYHHSQPGDFALNIDMYGARPLGFCQKKSP